MFVSGTAQIVLALRICLPSCYRTGLAVSPCLQPPKQKQHSSAHANAVPARLDVGCPATFSQMHTHLAVIDFRVLVLAGDGKLPSHLQQ